jgi:signal transduction histidine kinase
MRRPLERRWVVLLAAAVMFVVVFALRQTDSAPSDAVTLLYVIPILLVALELGVVAAVVASAVALVMVWLWSLTSQADLDAISNFSYVLAYLAVGIPAGRFADRMRDAQARHRRLLDSGLALAQLDPGGDVTGALVDHARRVVPDCEVVARLGDGPAPEMPPGPESFPVEVRSHRYGALSVTGRPLDADDRATLAILALQAAVASENQRLLRSERERAALHAELRSARVHLAERGVQLRELVARQEAERGAVAQELHEELAQVLAAALLGLASLERNLATEDERQAWQELRSDIRTTLTALRALAVSLRPPVLRLGLRAALEELAERARSRGFGEARIMLDDALPLTPEAETMTYRVVEEAITSVGTARWLCVRSEDPGLVVELSDPEHEIEEDRLTVLRARIELIGGTVSVSPARVRAVIPLRDEVVGGG